MAIEAKYRRRLFFCDHGVFRIFYKIFIFHIDLLTLYSLSLFFLLFTAVGFFAFCALTTRSFVK